MPLVHVKEDETFENALRRFKRKCEKSGILSELKKRQHYEKPSTKRKRKAIAARKKVLRKLAEERRTGYWVLDQRSKKEDSLRRVLFCLAQKNDP